MVMRPRENFTIVCVLLDSGNKDYMSLLGTIKSAEIGLEGAETATAAKEHRPDNKMSHPLVLGRHCGPFFFGFSESQNFFQQSVIALVLEMVLRTGPRDLRDNNKSSSGSRQIVHRGS